MVSTGLLRVRVYTSSAQLPLEGATVAVTARGAGGKRRLLSVQVTDSSGAIRPVAIETPEAWESESPRKAGAETPYGLCSVWAEAPGSVAMKTAPKAKPATTRCHHAGYSVRPRAWNR